MFINIIYITIYIITVQASVIVPTQICYFVHGSFCRMHSGTAER